jgi:hypothetical protein
LTGSDSLASSSRRSIFSEVEECDPETWLNEYSAKNVEVLCEQVAAQQSGFSTIMLSAELAD